MKKIKTKKGGYGKFQLDLLKKMARSLAIPFDMIRSGGGNREGSDSRFRLTTRTYQLRADSYDEKTRSVEAVIATEARVRVFDWERFEILDEILLMKGCKWPKGIRFLDTHDRSTVQKILGSTKNFRIEGDQLIARNFCATTEEGERANTLIKEGHLTDNSIGYRVNMAVYIEAGKSALVEGENYKAGERRLRIAVEWEVKENSACPVGMDETAKNRSVKTIGQDRKGKNGKGKVMKFEQWLQERGIKIEDLDEVQRAAWQKIYEGDQELEQRMEAEGGAPPTSPIPAATPDNVPPKPSEEQRGGISADEAQRIADKAAAEGVRAEQKRRIDIRSAAVDGTPEELITECIDNPEMTVDGARAKYLEHIRQNRPQDVAGIINREPTAGRAEIQAALLLRSGYDGEVLVKDKDYGEQVVNRADGFRDIPLIDVCRMALTLEGREIPLGRENLMRAAFSTTSLTTLLGAVAYKSMMKGYEMVKSTWERWCSIGNVSNFLLHTRLRVKTKDGFKEVGNAGEVPHTTRLEEKETIQAKTYAEQFGITRHNIINDDLDSFTRVPQEMGQDAESDLSDLVYETFMANGAIDDGTACFHANHSNLNTSTALGKAGLTACKLAFRTQTDMTGKTIKIAPEILLIPPDLEETGLEFMLADLLVATGVESSAQRLPAKNVHKGTLEIQLEARLSNSVFTNYSATTWYVTGDPKKGSRNVEVAFLNGVRRPVLQRFNPGPDYVGGIIFQMYYDAGVAVMDHRGMQKNTA